MLFLFLWQKINFLDIKSYIVQRLIHMFKTAAKDGTYQNYYI